MNPEDIARYLRLPVEIFYLIEEGEIEPFQFELAMLAQLYGRDIREFLGEEVQES